MLTVTVNHSAPLKFILDTGASGTVISERSAKELELESTAATNTTMQGGAVNSSSLKSVSLRVGPIEFPKIALTAIPLGGLEAGFGTRIDGILGVEAFERYVVEIDYLAKTVTFYEPRAFRYTRKGRSLPITFVDQTPFIGVKIAGAAGRKPVEASLLLDIGAVSTMTLYPAFVEKYGLFPARVKTLKITFGALISGLAGRVGRIREMRMGAYSVKQPFVTLPQKAGGDSYNDGLIGSEILRRFKVTIDYSRKRLILEPNRSLPEPYNFDASGMSLAAGGSDLMTIKVRSLVENSPAARAGIQARDIILTIDGKSVADMTLEQIRKMFRQPRGRHVLGLKRDATTLTITITTRKLI